jgi:hypothetical protein
MINPPERNMLEDPCFYERSSAIQEYQGGGALMAMHHYFFADALANPRQYLSFLRNKETACVICFNAAIPKGHYFLKAIKDDLTVALRENRAAIVVCRCAWSQLQRAGETVRVPGGNETFVIDDPRVTLREKLAKYGLVGMPIWAQLPHDPNLVPAKYRDAVCEAQQLNGTARLPNCWHASRNIMYRWLLWGGWLEKALEGHCGILE